MIDSPQPEMSVVFVIPDSCESVRKTLDHLRAQSAKARLELVFVAPVALALRLPTEELQVFAGVCLVEIDAIRSVGYAKAAGIRRARAPIIAFAEDHSFPDPGWAEALIEGYQGLVAAAAPVLVNANPDNAISWADMYLNFGPTIEPAVGGQVTSLPWHNSTYRRDLLLVYGSGLPAMLDVEGILHADLRRKGYALHLESRARTQHVNISLFPSFVTQQFYGGRLFAANRVKYYHWSVWQRSIRIIGAPLVPIIRLRRTMRDVLGSGRGQLLARMMPMLILGLAAHAFGELVGCARGEGDALQQRLVTEFHRDRHVVSRERQPG